MASKLIQEARKGGNAPVKTSAVAVFMAMIKFEHTVFALPFAYIGMLLAAGGWPGWWTFIWVTVAMVAARTVAMSFNRFADREIDALNPRTAERALPQGHLSSWATLVASGLSLVVLAGAAWLLNPICLYLLPAAALFLIGYSYTKRFTWLSHWLLGATDGIAVSGAWLAVRGTLDGLAFLLWFAVAVWIAGFDLIYACQDVEFDRRQGLCSVPAQFGVAAALRWARISHGLMIIALGWAGVWAGLGWPYWACLVAVTVLLIYEHTLVSPRDLSRVNVAFFNMNGYISIITLVGVILGLTVR
jgi:4-hydroxybenzoate polyprenyltransferase